MNPLELTISAGTGPVEAREFVRCLAEALRTELESMGALVEYLVVHGPSEAPHSVDIGVLCKEQVLARYVGSHELVQRSPLRAKRARKRWFAGVSYRVRAELACAAIDPRDLLFETCRARGAGGQHVNKTESAVRATHLPTGVSVRVDAERSQHQNKRKAIEQLARTLQQLSVERVADARASRRLASLRVERGRAVAGWHFLGRGLVRLDPEITHHA